MIEEVQQLKTAYKKIKDAQKARSENRNHLASDGLRKEELDRIYYFARVAIAFLLKIGVIENYD